MDSSTPQEATSPLYEVTAGRAVVRLNRPAHLNRIQAEDVAVLTRHFQAASADPAVKVMILTGTGRVFSSGFNIGDLAAGRSGRTEDDAGGDSPFERLTDLLENLSCPTICKLNGPVYGGSTDLALCCDFRIGTPDCEMFMPASRLGLHYYPAGISRYVSRLGINAAKKLFLTSEKIDAEEMLRIGYLTEIVAAGDLDARVEALGTRLAGQAPVATAEMKLSINEIARDSSDREAAADRHRKSLASQDIKEGLAAFLERREPTFVGA